MSGSKQATPSTNGDQLAYPPVALPKTQTEYREAILQAWRLGLEAGKPKPHKPKPGDGWNSVAYLFGMMGMLVIAPPIGIWFQYGKFGNTDLALGMGIVGTVFLIMSFGAFWMERKTRGKNR